MDILADSSHYCVAFMGICYLRNTNSSQVASEGALPPASTRSLRETMAESFYRDAKAFKDSSSKSL